MELLLFLLAFTLWECVSPPVSGGVAFVRALGRVRIRGMHGYGLLHPWPSARALVATRPPFSLHATGLRAAEPWLADGLQPATPIPYDALGRARVRGRSVRIASRTLCRCADRAEAAAVCSRLHGLAKLDRSERIAHLERWFAHSLDAERFARDGQRAARPLRWLGGCCDAYFLALCLLPLPVALLHEEPALWAALPVLAALHLATLVALYRAHGAVHPGSGAGRFETVFACALFPPSLLRTPQRLANDLASGFHPALVAGEMLDADELADLFRCELALLAREARGAEDELERCVARSRHAALLGFAAARGLTREALRAPRSHSDAGAGSYCVICRADYRVGASRCAGCDVPTQPYVDWDALPSPVDAPAR